MKKEKDRILNKSKYKSESSKIIKCFAIVLVIFGIMYLITTLILRNSDDTTYQNKTSKTSIQYDEILLGTTFDKKENEYLVLFYNVKNDFDNTYSNALSDYEAKDEKLPIYYVNLGNSMNKKCISSEENSNATNANELKINDVTLIKFTNHQIKEYITGNNNVIEYLNK